MSEQGRAPEGLRSVPLRLGAVALAAAITGVVVGGGGAYFLVRHFDPGTPAGAAVHNPPTKGGSSSTTVPALLAQLAPSLVEVIRLPADGSAVASDDISSGFIAGSGLVVTSEGAVAGAAGVEVALDSGQVLGATIAAADSDTGVVVLQVAATSLPSPLSFSATAPAVGDVALAVSFPVGSGPTIEVGSVSATGLTVTVPNAASPGGTSQLDGVFSTDTPQPQGSSGGPVVDSAGQVIGILAGDRMQPTDVGSSGLAAGYGLDAQAVANLVTDLLASGTVPEPTGLVCRWLAPASAAALGASPGALVVVVDSGSLAQTAGIQVGDVVTAVDGNPLGSTAIAAYPSFSDLLAAQGPGSSVRLSVLRGGVTKQVSLTLPSP
ncbi:MAG: S1C family serine protease [Candidatus Dormibacteria bacterium]